MITLEQAVKIYEAYKKEVMEDNIRVFAYAETAIGYFFSELNLKDYNEVTYCCNSLPCVRKDTGRIDHISDDNQLPSIDDYKCLPGAEKIYAKHQLRKRAEQAIDEELERLDDEAYEREVAKISTVPAYEDAIKNKMQEIEIDATSYCYNAVHKGTEK
ncbi:MAG: hypothetical protein IKS20_00140 [Victivallales bacterium]|nr:hypothetical protein [Victivallales bacterium]